MNHYNMELQGLRFPPSSLVNDLIGDFSTTPYRRDANSIITGSDCYGLWEVWLKTLFGIECNARDGKGDPVDFYRNFKKYENTYTALERPKDHCLVVMYTNGRKRRFAGHCGVYWRGQVVGMEEDAGCYVLMYENLKRQHRLVGQYMHPQLAMLK